MNWNSFNITCKNKRAIFTDSINFTSPLWKIVSLVSKRCTCTTRACCTDNFFCPYKLDVECSYTFCLYTGFDTLMLSSMKRKKIKIGQRKRFCGKSDWWKYTLLQNKRGRWFRMPPPPPPHHSFEHWWGNIDILYLILKGIVWRFRFILNF